MAEFGSLKVGDICKIVGNCNSHGFDEGEQVELYEIYTHSEDWKFKERGVPFRVKKVDGIEICYNIVREIDLERVEEMKEFTKSDLKELDECVFRNGNKVIFYQGDFRGTDERCISFYKENLLRDDSEHYVDIMQVIRNGEVIWERDEKSLMEIKLEELEKQQRDIADEIKKIREEL